MTNQTLTHFDSTGQAHMVDVGSKTETARVARAGHDAAQQSLAIHRLDVMFARELQGFRGVG